MPYILNKSEKSRVYQKADRFFVSQVQFGRLNRVVVKEDEANALIGLPDEALDKYIADMLLADKENMTSIFMGKSK